MIVTITGAHVRSKRILISDFIPTTSIGIVESKFPKLGYPRSNNSTADQCGPMREHHLTTRVIMRIEMHQHCSSQPTCYK